MRGLGGWKLACLNLCVATVVVAGIVAVPGRLAAAGARINVSDAKLVEGDGTTRALRFAIRLSQSSTRRVTVDAATENGSALAGADYEPVSTTIIFKPGSRSRILSVPVIGDKVYEPPPAETLFLRLSNPEGGALGDGFATGTIVDDDYADVAVTMSRSGPAAPTVPMTYTITVSNAGPKPSRVTVVDTPPDDVTIDSVDPSSGTCDVESSFLDMVVSCDLGSLAKRSTATVLIGVTPAESTAIGSSLTNEASASGSRPDPKPGNNAASDTATAVAASDLSISAVHEPEPVPAGETLRYTFTVANDGPQESSDVVIKIDIDPSLSIDSVASASGIVCTTEAGPKVTCTVPSFAQNASGTIQVDTVVGSSTEYPRTVETTGSIVGPNADRDTSDTTVRDTATVVDPTP